MGNEEDIEDQVSNLFCCCLKLLSDIYDEKNLRQMLPTSMGEEGLYIIISSPYHKGVCVRSVRRST